MSAPEPPRRPLPGERPTEPLNPAPAPQQPRVPVQSDPYAYERMPPERWWDNSGAAFVAGIVALLIGGGVGYLIGHESESEHTNAARTVTNTATVTQPKTVVQTVTASTVKETPSAANQADEQRLRESESNLTKAEKENRELRQKLEEAKP